MTRTLPLLLVLVLGCGGPASPTPATSRAPRPSERSSAQNATAVGFTGVELTPSPVPPLAYASSVVVEDGSALIFVDAERFVVVADEAAARVEPNPFGFEVHGGHHRRIPTAGGAFLIEGRDGLVAVDRETLLARWTRPLAESHSLAYLRSAGDVFVLDESGWIVGLDPTDGRELWRREEIANGGCDAAGHGVVVCGDWDAGLVIALDARTGRERFRVPVARPRMGPITEHGLAVFSASLEPGARGPQTFVVVDLDGRVRRSLVLDAPIDSEGTIVVGAHEVAVVVRPEDHAVEVRRYALGSEREPICSALVASSGVGDRELALVSGALLFRDDAFLIHALGPDLRETWLGQPTAGCDSLFPWTPRRGSSTTFVCLGARPSLYRASATLPARRTVTASGIVRCEGQPLARSLVQVAGALTETDSEGRYRVQTTVDAGSVRVGVPVSFWLDEVRYCDAPSWFVEADGGEVHADFELTISAGGLDGL